MATSAPALTAIFGRKPADIAKVPNLSVITKDRGHEHENPFVDRIDKDDALAFAPLFNGLADPCRRAFLLTLMDDRAERRIDVARLPPFAGQAVKAIG